MATLVERYGWHEWLCHTNFSFLVGASHPHELIDQACDFSYKGLGIADFDGVYGIARAYRDLRHRGRLGKNTDLKLYYGTELHLRADHDLPLPLQDTLVLFATNHQGYFHLCSLLSEAHREKKTGAFLSLQTLLAAPVEGLVALQAMRGYVRTQDVNSAEARERFGALREHFQGRFYCVFSRHLNAAEDSWMGASWELAKRLSLPVLLSQDVFFHTPERKALSDVLCAIRHNKTVENLSSQLFSNAERSLHSLGYIERLYSSLPFYEDALKNSCELAQSFAFDLDELRYLYPQEMIPPGYTSQTFLEKVVWEGCRRIYGERISTKTLHILQKELHLVSELGFADYFLTVWDIVRWARERHILCQGRGSAANSAICFVLGVTSLDPDKFDLLFERFLSLERRDPLDIDVDFEHERREEVIQYIYERYGRNRAAMVANVICFKKRGALRFVGKALGLPNEYLEEGSQALRSRALRRSDTDKVVAKVLDHTEKEVSDYTLDLWAKFSQLLIGFPRHLGIHSGGFVLTDKVLNWLVPVEPATMENRSVIQWSKDDIEGLGFFKIDVLALGMLTALRKTFSLVQKHYGHEINLAHIPSDDLQTYKMIQKADTVGTFQIESRAQMSFLPKHKPLNFYDLVVQIAIIRPGPIEGGMILAYLNRRLGREKISIPHPSLEPILRRTYGVPIFQEQVMRIAIAVGGFTAGEADELRKKIGSFTMKTQDVDLWLGKLVKGMLAHGIDQEFVDRILGYIRGFSSYGFPESHAASFAHIAYASAYLKAHYPEAFFTALLNSQPMGFYSVDTLLKTARHGSSLRKDHSVEVLPICLASSQWDCTLEPASSSSFRPFAIRLGLRFVRGLSSSFSSFRFLDPSSRAKPRDLLHSPTSFAGDPSASLGMTEFSRKDLTALAAAGALHKWGISRRAAIWLAEAAPFCEYLEDDEDEVLFKKETEWEQVQGDYSATGLSLGKHPAQILREQDWAYAIPVEKISLGEHLLQKRSGTLVHIFGLVLVRQAPPTAKNMLFITLEDESSYRPNLVVRPHIYEKFAQIIDRHCFLCVSGMVEIVDGACNVLVKDIHVPQLSQAELIPFAESMEETQEFALSRNYM